MSENFTEITENYFFPFSESTSSCFSVHSTRHPSLSEALFSSAEAIEKGLTRSEFSRRYLRADRNYLSVCRHRRTDLSARLVLRLYSNLRQRSDTWAAIHSVDTRVRERCNEKSLAYRKLAELALGALSQLGAATH